MSTPVSENSQAGGTSCKKLTSWQIKKKIEKKHTIWEKRTKPSLGKGQKKYRCRKKEKKGLI